MATEIGRPGVDSFQPPGRLTSIQGPRLLQGLIEQGKGAKDTRIRQHAATKNHAVATHKAVRTYGDRLTVLAVLLQVDGMGEELGVIAGNGGEGPDRDPIGAIDMMVLGNGGMIAQQEFAATLGLVGEVERIGTAGKTGDPVAPPDGGHVPEFQQIEVDRDSQGIDPGPGGHAQLTRVNPSQTDAGIVVKLVTKQPLQKGAFEAPGQDRDCELAQRTREASRPHG